MPFYVGSAGEQADVEGLEGLFRMGLSGFKVIKTIMVIGSPGIVALVGSHAVEDSGSETDPSDNAIG